MTLPPEYRQYLEQNLSALEQFAQAFSGLDERIDYTNILLTKLVELQGGIPVQPVEAPRWTTNLIEAINKLNVAISRISPLPVGELAFKNPVGIVAQKKLVHTAGTAVQLPTVIIPYGETVAIKALNSNTGTVYVGNSKGGAEDITQSFALSAGQGIEYKIGNLSQLWINSTVGNNGVNWTVEQ